MALAVFDIGGTTVKFGKWEQETLTCQDKFTTPATWLEMKNKIKEIVVYLKTQTSEGISGVAFSSPGSVYTDEGIIRGFSAVPYIHHFPIRKELTECLGLPVTFENDAYCAALAESWLGAAADTKNVVFIVIGTGVGGAIMVNGQLIKGKNMFGGEFGYMLLEEDKTFSDLGSPVRMAHAYSAEIGVGQLVSGMEVFDLADAGDEIAVRHVSQLKRNIARGIQTLLVATNPDKVVIGGGISAREGLIEDISVIVNELLIKTHAGEAEVMIVPCHFRNDANLIGAVAAYLNEV